MKLEDLLNDVKKTRTKQAEAAKKGSKKAEDAAAGSQIPQDLTAGQEHEMPKNIATEAQQGDQQKVMELLDAIEQGGEAAGAAENLTEAKIAEEMAILDQAIIDKQAEYFGVKMAESFVNRVVELNNPHVSEKEAAEYVKAAAEEEYSRWFNAGQALRDGYVSKAAEFPATEGGEGIIDNGEQLVPSEGNASEVDVLARDLAQYLATGEALEEGLGESKAAAEKEAKVSELFGKLKAFFSGMPGKIHGGMKSVGTTIKKHPVIAGSAAVGAGAAGAGAYMATRNKKSSDESNKQPKQSEKIAVNAGAILAAFKSGVIGKKEAAERLAPLMN